MTEHEFDQKVEAAAQRFERRVEHATSKLDNGLTGAWNCSRVFRTVSRSASFAAGGRAFAGGAPSGRAGARRSGRLLLCTGGGRAVGRACRPYFSSQKIAAVRAGARARLLPTGLPRQTTRGGPKADGPKRRTPPGSQPHTQRRAPYAASACAAPGELSVKHFTLLYLTGKKEGFPCEKPSFFCIILPILYK